MDAKLGKFDIIIIHKLDRFSRSIKDSLTYFEELEMYGVNIESVTESFDNTPQGRMQLNIQLVLNQYYSDNLGAETIKGLKVNARNGASTGGKPPLGYSLHPVTKKYILNEYEASSVKVIFEKFLEGYSYQKIVEYLNENNYVNSTGKPFVASSIYDVLRNEKYKGNFIYNKRVRNIKGKKRSNRRFKDEEDIIILEGGIPRIISDEMFDQAQNILNNRKRQTGIYKTRSKYLLTGKIQCTECSNLMVGNVKRSGRNKERYSYYQCNNHYKSRDKCSTKDINKDYIEKVIIDLFSKSILDDFELISDIMQELNDEIAQFNSNIEIKQDKLRSEIKRIHRDVDNILDNIHLFNEDNSQFINEKVEQKNKMIESKSREISQLEKLVNTKSVSKVEVIELLKKLVLDLREDSTKDNIHKLIIEKFVKDIQVSNNKIKIELVS